MTTPSQGPSAIGGARRNRRSRPAARDKASLRRFALEGLEPRALMATLPTATPSAPVDISNSGGNESSPSIAINPLNPNQLVSVWTRFDPNLTNTPVIVEGAVSANSGATWTKFTVAPVLSDPTTSNPVLPFAQTTDATVAFDRNGNFYVVTSQHKADNTAGAILLNKFTAGAGTSPTRTITNKVIYGWTQDRALKPVVAVDSSVASFGDVDANGNPTSQSDQFSGNVYVAWATNDQDSNNVGANFNPNTIRLVASSDGGNTFSGYRTLDDGGHFGTQRETAPQLAVSQGSIDGKVKGGQVTAVWDDFGTLATSSLDLIKADHVDDGAVAQGFDFSGSSAIGAGATTFNIPVNISDARFTTVSDLTVRLDFAYPNMGDLTVQLLSPGGQTITLAAAGRLTGANAGVDPTSGKLYDLVFDATANRTIANGQAPYLSDYRPDAGSLAQFNGLAGTSGNISGQWRLVVTNSSATNVGSLAKGQLVFTSRLTQNRDANVANTTVRGALTGAGQAVSFPTASAASPFGIGPAPQIAADNTLGAYSANQGRIYIAYVDRYNPNVRGTDPGDGTNPADNTDVFLTSTDGTVNGLGQLVFDRGPTQVNDDSALADGDTESLVSMPYVTGRAQFLPQVAVDQATGTLVYTFFDTRNDAARARTAEYITTSIDGGRTFSPQTFVNSANTAFDEITRKNVALGPVPDNQSAGNANREAANFAFGDRQGLAVFGGKAFPAWSSNANGVGPPYDPPQNSLLDIRVTPTVFGAGPRVIDSTMGEAHRQAVLALDGTSIEFNAARDPITGAPVVDGFVVTFDRPVDPASFTADDVLIGYRNPTTPGASAPTESFGASSVVPLAAGASAQGATRFLVQFPPHSGTGTYSYQVGPDVRDRIRSVTAAGTSLGNAMDQNADAATGDAYAAPRATAAGPLDPTTLPLTIPGPHVADTLTFDAPAGQFPLAIPDLGTATSTLTIGGDAGRQVTSATVELSISHPNTRDLRIVLIAPDGTQVVLAQNLPTGVAPSANFLFTTFDDKAATPITGGTGPYTGSFRPSSFSAAVPGSGLGALAGKLVAGTWTLRVQDTLGNNIGAIQSWSLTLGTTLVATDRVVDSFHVVFDRDMDPSTVSAADVLRVVGPAGAITGTFAVAADPNFDPSYPDPDPAHPRTYRVTLPPKAAGATVAPAELSGTYVVTLGPDIRSESNEAIDADRNAGLDVLRGTPSAGTVSLSYPSADVPKAIGGAAAGVVTTSTIDVPDSFFLQGVTVSLDITYPNDPDLKATLIGPDPDGPGPLAGPRVVLFQKVGATGSHANFSSTVFSDQAATPIQDGGPPFFGTFQPKEPLGQLVGINAQGTWTLEIVDSAAGRTGTLNSWSLAMLRPLSSTGLGDPAADRTTVSFRIFTQDPANPLASDTWTAVGPAGIGAKGPNLNGQVAGKVSAIAVDPTDPSGNTVYVGAASGGVWKTSDFLTTKPTGPTYVPLTDFGTVGAQAVGALAVFGRNNDPNQSVVFAGTGDPDMLGDPQTAAIQAQTTNQVARGFGLLRSFDGGLTWTLLDSTNNNLPFAQRDHRFANTVAFKVVVDPKPTPTGDVIVYMALSDINPANGAGVAGTGTSGGLWRSLDSGRTWQLMKAGQATDVVLDEASGTGGPTGNLQTLYAAFRGDGVYSSPNRGQVFTLMAGTTGDPLIQNADQPTPQPVGVTASTTPNGAKGRIVLARPALVPASDPNATLKNLLYQGWLYAAVATTTGPNPGVYNPGSHLDGLYMTKDFGQNWVKVRIPSQVPTTNPPRQIGLPSNDTAKADIDPTGVGTPLNTNFGTANYALSLAIDPNDPNVVYLGGSNEFNSTGLIRVDTTGISDAHSFFLGQDGNDGGTRLSFSATHVVETNPTTPLPPITPPYQPQLNPTLNFVRDPGNPFVSGSTILVTNVARFANTGAGGKWIPLDRAVAPDPYANPQVDPFGIPTRGEHRILTAIDPLTHATRLIFANDQGVYTALANSDGSLVGSIGSTGGAYTVNGVASLDTPRGDMVTAQGSRNGNLQIAQFNAGAAQPSELAAQAAFLQGLFYGNSQTTGQSNSSPNVVDPSRAGSGYGNISWTGATRGTGGGVATEQNFIVNPANGQITARGTQYQYITPETLNADFGRPSTDFFQVNGTGRTFGLVQVSGGGDVPDPQWPYRQAFNFSVNPLNGDQILISSATGNVFGTENQGRTWNLIGDRAVLDGTNAQALAYGAPDPNGPGGVGNLDNLLYAGTLAGNVFLTQTGGGGTGNQWSNIAFFPNGSPRGLDGSAIESIITSPTRGSHEAYVVTRGGTGGTFAATAGANGQNLGTLPDATAAGPGVKNSTLAVPRDFYMRNLTATVAITHANDADLKVELVAPDGTTILLAEGLSGANLGNVTFDDNAAQSITQGTAPYVGTFRPLQPLSTFFGRDMGGTWTLRVTDKNQGVVGSLVGWSLATTNSLGGVYHIGNSTSTDPNDPQAYWRGVAGNVFRLTDNAFGDPNLAEVTAKVLTTVVADWRYDIPGGFDQANPYVAADPTAANAPTHPVLYLAAEAGVYRSVDGGLNWLPFPSPDPDSLISTPTPPAAGGGLPHVRVTDLDLSLGNIDPATGRPRAFIDADGNPATTADQLVSPSVLLATTYGRGSFSIRLTPQVLPALLRLDPTLPAPDGSDSGTYNNDKYTNVAQPFIAGVSQQSAFGDSIGITLFDETDPANPVVIGTGQTDATGRFSIQIIAGHFKTDGSTDGPKVIGVQATDINGIRGNIALLRFTLDTRAPVAPPAPDLEAGSDSGQSNTDDLTNFNDATPAKAPVFDVGTAGSPIENRATVQLFRAPLVNGVPGTAVLVATRLDTAGGVVAIADTGGLIPDGVYVYTARQVDLAGNVGPMGPGLTVTIDTTGPLAGPPDLTDDTDTGRPRPPRQADDITKIPQPDFQGNVEPFATVQLFVNGVAAGVGQADATGYYLITAQVAMAEGLNNITVQETDVAGNTGPVSGVLVVTLDTTPPGPITPALDPADDSGRSNGDNNTFVNRPSFIGMAEPFALVQIYAQMTSSDPNAPPQPLVLAGEGVADAVGNYRVTVGTYVLPLPQDTIDHLDDGVYEVSAVQTDVAGNRGRDTVFGNPGTIIIDGTDADDHGSFNAATNQNEDGWLYMQKVLENIGPNVANGNKRVTALLGMDPNQPNNKTAQAIRSAFNLSTLPALGWTLEYVFGTANVDSYLSGNAVGSARLATTGILYIPTVNNNVGDLLNADQAVLNRHGQDIADFANAGGGLYSQAENPTPNSGQVAYGWLSSLFTNISSVEYQLRRFTGIQFTITPAGMAAFPGLQPQDLQGGPWHNYFDAVAGDFSPLAILATSPDDDGIERALILTTTVATSRPTIVIIDTTPPDPPATPDLQAASDTGPSNTDNVTGDSSPVFDVAGVEPFAILELFRDGVLVATVIDPAGGTVAIQDPGPLADGVYRYTARQTDIAGNVSGFSGSLTITVIVTPPPVPGVPDLLATSDSGRSNTDDITFATAPVFNVAPAVATDTVQLLRNGVVVATRVGPGQITDPGPVADGVYTYTARQVDLAGNQSPQSPGLSVTIDTTPPAQPAPPTPTPGSITGPNNNTSVTNPTFDTTQTEPLAIIQLLRKLVGTPANLYIVVGQRIGTGQIQDPGPVPDGTYDYATREVDVAGNVGPVSASTVVTIDTTRPLAPGVPDLQASSDSGSSSTDNVTSATIVRFPVFDIAPAEATATVQLLRNGVVVATRIGPGAIADPGPTFADGVYAYTSRQIDLAGNVGPQSAALLVTLDNTSPAFPAAPDLQAGSDSGISNTDNITAVTNPTFDVAGVEAGATLQLLRDGVVVATMTNVAGGTVAIQDPGPVADGVHRYTALQFDVAGNASPVGPALQVTIDTAAPTFVPGVPDLQAASDSGPSNTDDYTNVTAPAFTITPVEAGFTVQLLRDGLVVASRVGPGPITDPGPLADGVYRYTSREVDAAGNIGPASAALVVTVDTTVTAPGVPDLQAASDSGPSSSDDLTNVANPTFDVAPAEFNATVQLLRDGVVVATRVGPGAIADPGPVADGAHVYSSRQIDLAGNVSGPSAGLTVTIDTTPPPAPAAPDLEAASDTGSSNTDNVTSVTSPTFDLAGVDPGNVAQLLRNNVVVAVRVGPGPITDPGPLADGTYTYAAKQVDPAGNASAASPVLQVTVLTAAPAAPGVPDLQAASDTGASNTDNITRSAAPTFDVGPAEATSTVRLFRDGNPVASRVGPGPITDPGPVADGPHTYTAQQFNAVGGVSPMSAGLTVVIDTTAPAPGALTLLDADDSGVKGDRLTNVRRPRLTGTTEAGAALELLDAAGNVLGTATAGADGSFTLRPNADLADGQYALRARATDLAGNSAAGSPLTLTIDTAAPAASALALDPADDTGVAGDGVTARRQPRLTGTTGPGATVQLLDAAGNVLGAATAGNDGSFSIRPTAGLPFGRQALRARATDAAGNVGAAGPALALTILKTAGDYDGDGKADLATFRPTSVGGATWTIALSANGATRTQSFGAATDVPLQGDFDGDGVADLAVYRPSTAQWFILQSHDGPRVMTFGAANTDLPVPGDYDGDGKDDLAVYRPGTGQWLILQSTAGGRIQAFGAAVTDKPIQADYDGDGKVDLAVYRPSTAQFLILQSTAGAKALTFGAPNLDQPAPEDYDGDGKADIALYRPSTSQWFILQSTAGPRGLTFGQANVDVPVPRDYDGDGKADVAVFRPTTAQWLVLQSTAGPRVQVLGAANDVPVPAPLTYRQRGGGATAQSLDLGGAASRLSRPAVAVAPGGDLLTNLDPASPFHRPRRRR